MLKKLLPEIVKAPMRTYLHSRLIEVWRPGRMGSFSQAGQDFWMFGEVFNEKRDGFFLDVGAYDGVYLSNSYVLEKRYGWRGICVEANPDSFRLLQKNRSATCVNVCLAETEGFVNFAKKGEFSKIVGSDNKVDPHAEVIRVRATTFCKLLKELNAPKQIDYLSIDIEGAEEEVLKDFSFSDYVIKCMTVERPGNALKGILERNGFRLIKEIPGLDCFYLHNDLVEQYESTLTSFYKKKYFR
jgi:FkbM family methyltransferase